MKRVTRLKRPNPYRQLEFYHEYLRFGDSLRAFAKSLGGQEFFSLVPGRVEENSKIHQVKVLGVELDGLHYLTNMHTLCGAGAEHLWLLERGTSTCQKCRAAGTNKPKVEAAASIQTHYLGQFPLDHKGRTLRLVQNRSTLRLSDEQARQLVEHIRDWLEES